MKRILLTTAILSFILNYLPAQIIFSEDFDGVGGPTAGGAGTYSFPSGWTLFNVDGSTPDASVSYVNDAWERREDFANNTADSAAFSTSWYAPAGPADDWMFTPAINLTSNNVLKWNAVAYDASFPDGYEVRISTTTPTVANALANAALFTIAAENDAWTARSVDLEAAGYANQTVYIAFRNNSTDQFLLLIDDVEVQVQVDYDARVEAIDTPSQYTIVPISQVVSVPLSATVSNNGGMAVTNVTLTANVYDGSFVNISSVSSTPVASLAAGNSTNLTAGSFTPPAADIYYFEYVVSITEADGEPSNDTMVWMTPLIVSDSVYARDNANVTGALGIGVPGGNLGQQFDIVNAIPLTSVSFFVTRGWTGRPVSANIWNVAGGVPDSIIARTDTLIYPDDSSRLYTIGIAGGDFILTPSTYAVTMQEYDSTIALGQTSGIFTNGTTWVDFPGSPFGGWANNEDFGPNFAKPYALRINVNCSLKLDNIAVTGTNCFGGSDGIAGVVVSGVIGTETYQWSNGGNAAALSGVPADTYTVTVTDGGCIVTATADVPQPAQIQVASSSTDATCSTCTDGTATATATGGTGPFTYEWSTGETTASIIGLGVGTYEFTATDTKGCEATGSVDVDVETTGIAFISPGISFEVYPNPVSENFNVRFQSASTVSVSIEVYSVTGQRVYSLKNNAATEFTQSISVQTWSSGVYEVTVKTDAGSSVMKIVKE